MQRQSDVRQVVAELHNEAGEKVATFTAEWHVTVTDQPPQSA